MEIFFFLPFIACLFSQLLFMPFSSRNLKKMKFLKRLSRNFIPYKISTRPQTLWCFLTIFFIVCLKSCKFVNLTIIYWWIVILNKLSIIKLLILFYKKLEIICFTHIKLYQKYTADISNWPTAIKKLRKIPPGIGALGFFLCWKVRQSCSSLLYSC